MCRTGLLGPQARCTLHARAVERPPDAIRALAVAVLYLFSHTTAGLRSGMWPAVKRRWMAAGRGSTAATKSRRHAQRRHSAHETARPVQPADACAQANLRRHAPSIPYTCRRAERLHALSCVQPVLVVMGMCVLPEFLGLGAPSIDADLYVVVFALYVAVDFVYVWIVPESTPQPGIILVHHVRTRTL